MNPLLVKVYRECEHADRNPAGDCLDCDNTGITVTLMPLEEAVRLAHIEAVKG